jgi:hypothetical protein
MKRSLFVGLWRFVGVALFIVIALGWGFESSGYVFSARTVAAIVLVTGWFISEAVELRAELLGDKVKRASEWVAVFLMFGGALLLLSMYTGRLAPSATFLESALALLLACSRTNAHFDLGRRLKEMSERSTDRR